MLHNVFMHAYLFLEEDFLCHENSRKGDKAIEAELVLAVLKKQALTGL